MSTRFTKKGVPMKNSMTLKLVQSAGLLQTRISQMLVDELQRRGYQTINISRLAFLSTLECGVNYASEVSRNLGVSRQMVAKTVKELCELGYLSQEKAVGKQKPIVFTLKGEQLIGECRNLLLALDEKLKTTSATTDLNQLVSDIQNFNKLLI